MGCGIRYERLDNSSGSCRPGYTGFLCEFRHFPTEPPLALTFSVDAYSATVRHRRPLLWRVICGYRHALYQCNANGRAGLTQIRGGYVVFAESERTYFYVCAEAGTDAV